MTRNDIDSEIISILEKGPNSPENIWNELKDKGFSKPTYYRHWKKLKQNGKIRQLTEAERTYYGIKDHRKIYYVLAGTSIEDKKRILLEVMQKVDDKNARKIMAELRNYLNFINKESEIREILNFYHTMKKNLSKEIFTDNLIQYSDFFIAILNIIIKKYKRYQNSMTNPFKDVYEKAVDFALDLFEDVLSLFNEEVKQSNIKFPRVNRPDIIFPIMDALNEMKNLEPNNYFNEKNHLFSLDGLIGRLEKMKNISMEPFLAIITRYLEYEEERLEENLKLIRKRELYHYKKCLEEVSNKDEDLYKYYEQILRDFEFKF